jgi:aminoglycoside 3-N-acetyltransferase
MRNFIRRLIPTFLLEKFREFKKKKINQQLKKDLLQGKIITKKELIKEFEAIGIKKGETLLVHSSLSKIGYVENGPKDVVEALLEVVGENGNLLMPNSPNAKFQIDYIRELDFFDVKNAISKLGGISEYFRKLPKAQRSAHPTEPVSCIGPDSDYLVGHHFGNITPYNQNSPFYKISEKAGKILYLGVTFDNAGTNLHTIEDAIENFKYPIYHNEEFEVNILFENGTLRKMKTKVHNPEQSKKRKCDGLIPLLEEKGALKKIKIGNAPSLLVDAKLFFEILIKAYHEKGITMYTPNGE